MNELKVSFLLQSPPPPFPLPTALLVTVVYVHVLLFIPFQFAPFRRIASSTLRCVSIRFVPLRFVCFSVLFRFNEISFHGKTSCSPLVSPSPSLFICEETCATNFPLNSPLKKRVCYPPDGQQLSLKYSTAPPTCPHSAPALAPAELWVKHKRRLVELLHSLLVFFQCISSSSAE